MELQVVHNQEVLGKEFKIYGTKEEPLFLAKDVAEWIEHSNVTMMLKKIDTEEVTKQCLGGLQGDAWFLTEDGLYEVLMQSRKPIAKAFKKEVKNILKQIRQTGGYIPVNQEESDEEFLARALMIAQRTLAKKDKLIEQQQKTIEFQAPKVERYDEYIEADGTYTSETLGKKLGFKSARAFNSFLKENKLIFKRTTKGKWIPSAKLPSETYKLIPFIKPTGEAIENLRFTPMMVDYLKEMKLV